MEERKERFLAALDYAKRNGLFKTQQELADRMGATKSSISVAKSGDPEYLTDKFLARFNRACEDAFYLPWLIAGHGTMLGEVAVPQSMTVPVIPLSSSGGSLVDIVEDGVKLEDCERVHPPVSNAQYAIGVYGDSMEPTFPNGCRVFIRKIDPSAFIAWGNVYVLDTINGTYVKEVRKGSDPQHILCVSHNTACGYEPFEISLDDVYGMYRVLASVQVVG